MPALRVQIAQVGDWTQDEFIWYLPNFVYGSSRCGDKLSSTWTVAVTDWGWGDFLDPDDADRREELGLNIQLALLVPEAVFVAVCI